MTEFFAAVARLSVFVFLVSSMSEIGLGLRLQQIVSVMVIVTTLIGLIVLVPAALLMGKYDPARLNRLD